MRLLLLSLLLAAPASAQSYDLLSTASYDPLAGISAPAPQLVTVTVRERVITGYQRVCNGNGTCRLVPTYGYRTVTKQVPAATVKPPAVAPRSQAAPGRSPCGCPLAPHSNCQAHGGCNTAARHAVCGRGGSFCHKL